MIEVFKEASAHREQQFEVGQRALLERALNAEHEADAMRIGNGHLRDRVKQLQDVVNDFVCTTWREMYLGDGVYFKGTINPELLERARAMYQPNNRDDQRRGE